MCGFGINIGITGDTHSRTRIHTGSTPTSSTTFDKMKKDKRYAPANEVPDEIISTMGSEEIFSPGFSIKGQALAGRASYLVRPFSVLPAPLFSD